MKRIRRSTPVALIGLFLAGLLQGVAGQAETLPLGAPAPDFTLPGVDGRAYTLADFAASPVLMIVFTCNHCPTAQAYEDRLIQITEDYRDRGVAVVAISPNDPDAIRLDELNYSDLNDSFEEMKIRARDKGFPFPYLYDGDTQAASRAYGPVATPHVFLFDEVRTLRYVGRVDDAEKAERVTQPDVRNALDALLAGAPVPVAQTKVFGCSVKWGDKRSSVQDALAKWSREPVTLERIGIDGVRALMQNETGKLRLVNVWATWCGPCVTEFPELVAMHRMYRSRDFELITISTDNPEIEAKVLDFLKTQQASTRNYLFEQEDIYALIEAVDEAWPGALPYTVLVEPGGAVRYREVGTFDPLALKRAIVDYLGRTYE